MTRLLPLLLMAAQAGEPVDTPAITPTVATQDEPAVFPAGSFQQGGTTAPDARWQRRVTLSAYGMDRSEVTIAAFDDFVAQGWTDDQWWTSDGLAWRGDHPEGAGDALRRSDRSGDHPVVAVTWHEASAYCAWAGGRLPTEAEWERAACGPHPARFPWGDDEPEGPAWFTGGKLHAVQRVITHPALQQDPSLVSPEGMLHTAGNVWEWTADSYRASAYDGGDVSDPLEQRDSPWRVLRGGSYMNLPSYCSCRHREPARPDQPRLTTGFRCAYDG